MRIVFFGTSDFAVPALKTLHDNDYEIAAIVTVPDKSVGRKQIMTAPPAKLAALKLGIPVHQPASLKKDEQFFELFKSWQPDICVVAAYGKIIPQRYLGVPKYDFVNIHPSLLPKYRGPTPIQSAILNGETETGITIMKVDAEMDHGAIIKQTTYNLQPTTYYKEVHDRLAETGARLLVEILPKYINGEIKPKEQDHDQATFTKMFEREDGRINWSESGDKIHNLIRALNPEPGTWTTWKGKVINIMNVTTFNVVSPQVTDLALEVPGTVRKTENNIVIGTGTGYLILISVQLEGGKEMDAKSFVNGHPDFIGFSLE